MNLSLAYNAYKLSYKKVRSRVVAVAARQNRNEVHVIMTTNLKAFNSIREFIKLAIKPWKQKIIKQCHEKCVISGNWRGCDVHHVSRSFDSIFRETFEVTGIPFRKQTYEYTEAELTQLQITCLALHSDVTGILVSSRLHILYHQQYGNEVTIDNWKEFKSNWKKIKKVS